MNDEEKFIFYKNAEYNHRFNLRAGKRIFEPINDSFRFNT